MSRSFLGRSPSAAGVESRTVSRDLETGRSSSPNTRRRRADVSLLRTKSNPRRAFRMRGRCPRVVKSWNLVHGFGGGSSLSPTRRISFGRFRILSAAGGVDLLRAGAQVVTGVSDVLGFLGLSSLPRPDLAERDDDASPRILPTRRHPNAHPRRAEAASGASPESLARVTGLSASLVLAVLSELEIAGPGSPGSKQSSAGRCVSGLVRVCGAYLSDCVGIRLKS